MGTDNLGFVPSGKVTAAKSTLLVDYIIALACVGMSLFMYFAELRHPALLISGGAMALLFLLVAFIQSRINYYWNDDRFAAQSLTGKLKIYSYADIDNVALAYGKLGIFMKNGKRIFIETNSCGISEFINKLNEKSDKN